MSGGKKKKGELLKNNLLAEGGWKLRCVPKIIIIIIFTIFLQHFHKKF